VTAPTMFIGLTTLSQDRIASGPLTGTCSSKNAHCGGDSQAAVERCGK
jgi:hypothetical protein